MEFDPVFGGRGIPKLHGFGNTVGAFFQLANRAFTEVRLMPAIAGKRGRKQMPCHQRRSGEVRSSSTMIAPIRFRERVFDVSQALFDSIQAFAHRIAQIVDALALEPGGNGKGTDDGQSDLKERLLPPVHVYSLEVLLPEFHTP